MWREVRLQERDLLFILVITEVSSLEIHWSLFSKSSLLDLNTKFQIRETKPLRFFFPFPAGEVEEVTVSLAVDFFSPPAVVTVFSSAITLRFAVVIDGRKMSWNESESALNEVRSEIVLEGSVTRGHVTKLTNYEVGVRYDMGGRINRWSVNINKDSNLVGGFQYFNIFFLHRFFVLKGGSYIHFLIIFSHYSFKYYFFIIFCRHPFKKKMSAHCNFFL